MKDRVKIFSVRLSGDSNSAPKELERLVADTNSFLEGTEGTLKKIEPITFVSYGTYMALIVTYEEKNAYLPHVADGGFDEDYGMMEG